MKIREINKLLWYIIAKHSRIVKNIEKAAASLFFSTALIDIFFSRMKIKDARRLKRKATEFAFLCIE